MLPRAGLFSVGCFRGYCCLRPACSFLTFVFWALPIIFLLFFLAALLLEPAALRSTYNEVADGVGVRGVQVPFRPVERRLHDPLRVVCRQMGEAQVVSYICKGKRENAVKSGQVRADVGQERRPVRPSIGPAGERTELVGEKHCLKAEGRVGGPGHVVNAVADCPALAGGGASVGAADGAPV